MTCQTCNDTHRMPLGDRQVLCTRCPRPCRDCARGGNGAYCSETPCSCQCHRMPTAVSRADGERTRARDQITRLRTMLDSVMLDVEARGYPPGVNAAQAVTEAAISLAMTMAKLDAYLRAESKP